MEIGREGELLVLGADAELRLRLAALLEPRDELVARFDRRQVNDIASHEGIPDERAATLHKAEAREQCGVSPRRPLSLSRLRELRSLSHPLPQAGEGKERGARLA